MESTVKPVVYTVEQLMQIVATGACAVPSPGEENKVCADKTDAAFLDASTLKRLGTSRVRMTVRNTSAVAKFFGFGQSLTSPGLTPLYNKSIFAGSEGVNDGAFFVGDQDIANASGSNSLATQAFMQHNPWALISGFSIVRVDESDPILANDLIFERTNPANGRCTTSQVSPECNSCTGSSSSSLVTARYAVGLAPADVRNAFGIEIPPGGEGAPTYTIDVDLAFTEGAIGYVPVSGGGLGCK